MPVVRDFIMKEKKIGIFLILFTILIFSANAISMPISISDEYPAPGIHIEPSTREYLKQNTDYMFSAHLFGLALHQVDSQDAVVCYLHFYDVNGSHLIQETMDINANGIDFQKLLNSKNLSNLGEHDWIIYCSGNFYDANDTLIVLNGFTRGRFIVTKSGYDISNLSGMTWAILLGLFCITLLFALGTWYFENELKMFFLLLTLISAIFNVFILANLNDDAIINPQTNALLWLMYKVMLWVFMFIFFWIIYKLFSTFKASKKIGVETDNANLMRKLPK